MISGKQMFYDVYGATPTHAYAASGRVNIIGEHIDYNGGFVLPVAIGLGCTIYCRVNNTNSLRVAFNTTDKKGEIDYSQLDTYKDAQYINYLAGVCKVLKDDGLDLVGLDTLYEITVPFGSGLSSSAAIEVSTGYMLHEMSKILKNDKTPTDKVKLALDAQKAENQYIGVNCGIMDQFASANGKKDHCILLDCATLKYEFIPIKNDNYYMMIINTNKPHNLVESKYNERRSQCEQALEYINKTAKKSGLKAVKQLCELSVDEFTQLAQGLHLVLYNRAKHCVEEQQRVKSATVAVSNGDIEALGLLLKQSHQSLKELYEVSCKELDAIVDIASDIKECVGVRMTGAGFGGSCVAFFKNNSHKQQINEYIKKQYKIITNLDCSIYDTNIEDGARVIDIVV